MRDPGELAKIFRKEYDERRENWAENGASEIIENLSRSVSSMRAAGIDVSLDMKASWSQQAFALVHHKHSGTVYIHAYGVLRVGNTELLVGIGKPEKEKQSFDGPQGRQTREVEAKKCRLFLSTDDIEYHGGKKEVRSGLYNVLNDPKAWDEFEERVVYFAAGEKLIDDLDVENALNTDKKRGRSPKLKSGRLKIGD